MTAPLLVCDIPVLSRIQKSPIPDTPGDYRRSLQSHIGICYSELRRLAEEEHWVAVWGRRKNFLAGKVNKYSH